jgi:hypothetical protein
VAKEKKPQEVIDGIRVARARKDSFSFDREVIAERIADMMTQFERDRHIEKSDRLQRYAKFRQWTSGKVWPFTDASDIQLPDITTQCLRAQDSLHNAVMSARPPVIARPMDEKSRPAADNASKLIDHQIFIDMPGERFIGDICEEFVNDGVFTVFIPWVKERREMSSTTIYGQFPQGADPSSVFVPLILQHFGEKAIGVLPRTEEGWDWIVNLADGATAEVAFFTRQEDAKIELVSSEFVTIFDGPRPQAIEWDDCLYPARAANLQAPGPSNPGGAAMVMLRSFPTLDEIMRLQKSGFYDLMTEDDVTRLTVLGRDTIDEEMKEQTDQFQGVVDQPVDRIRDADLTRTFNRLLVFDVYDIDGDGIAEDVVWWYIVETKTVVRGKLMTEVWPLDPPRRPLAEAAFIPVKGRRGGISQIELLEGLHDAMKIILDQSIDAGTLTNAPFFFYRPAGALQPTNINLEPGEGYPLGDPKNDVHFPNIQSNNQAWSLNLVGLFTNMQERTTMQGDFQLGRVPPGRSSALRTVSGMAMLQNQGEARPERILRRFFTGLTDTFEIIHALNRIFLPPEKNIIITGIKEKTEDPYLKIDGPAALDGNFVFAFDSNVFNSSRQALQEGLGTMIEVLINQFTLQSGITTPETAYRLYRDFAKAQGQDPDQYLNPPTPEAMLPRIFAEDALTLILQSMMPNGVPAEAGGAQEHLAKIQEFTQSDQFGIFEQANTDLLGEYMKRVQLRAMQQARQQALLQAAAQQGNGAGQPVGRPPEGAQQNPIAQPTATQEGQLADQTLPGPNNALGGEDFS